MVGRGTIGRAADLKRWFGRDGHQRKRLDAWRPDEVEARARRRPERADAGSDPVHTFVIGNIRTNTPLVPPLVAVATAYAIHRPSAENPAWGSAFDVTPATEATFRS